MSEPLRERLWKELLPSLYRVRDTPEGEPLRALLGVIETELQTLEDDLTGLYDNWFVETADPWVVPYLADLLGVRGVRSEEGYSRRAYVANTLGYRRRKGTAGVMESLAFAETGWQARAVEFFQRLQTTQYSNHIRLQNQVGVNLRPAPRLELCDGPFEDAAHTVDVRRIATTGGRYNIPNVGIHLWRLQPYLVKGATARFEGSDGANRYYYRFDGIERDIPLFNSPRTETDGSALATEIDVPARLRARELGAALRDLSTDEYAWWFQSSEPVFQVFLDNVAVGVLPEDPAARRVQVFHRWRREDPAEDEAVNDWANMAPGEGCVLVDPERGRLVVQVPSGTTAPAEVTVDFRYGFSGELGGGPYDRTRQMGDDWAPDSTGDDAWWQRGVSREHHQLTPTPDPKVYETLTEALAAWDAAVAAGPVSKVALLTIMDSRTYEEDLTITVPENTTLWIVAAGWEPPTAESGLPTDARIEGSRIVLAGPRPHLRGTLTIAGGTGSRLLLNGLRIEGPITVDKGDLAELRFAHCTAVPGAGGLTIDGGTSTTVADANANLGVVFTRSVCAGITAVDTLPSIALTDTVVDRLADGVSLSAMGADLTATECTVLGSTSVRAVALGSNCVFADRLFALRRQEGCVRFSYFPQSSQTPRAFRCQPELALSTASPDLVPSLLDRVQPGFTSTIYGDPGYAQLRRSCPDEIRAGAEDGDAMGALHFLKQTTREVNLREALAQYTRAGLSVGIFYVT